MLYFFRNVIDQVFVQPNTHMKQENNEQVSFLKAVQMSE